MNNRKGAAQAKGSIEAETSPKLRWKEEKVNIGFAPEIRNVKRNSVDRN